MEQERVVLPGTEREPPKDAEVVGQPNPEDRAEVTLILRRRTPMPPRPELGAVLSRQEFAVQYAADPEDIAIVEKFAQEHGLTVDSSDASRRTVILSGSIGALSSAFGADLQVYQREGETFRSRTGVMSVPASLAGVVEGVFGLDQRPQARSRLRHRPPIRPLAAGDTSYTPVEVARAYRFPADVTGSGQTVAIIELGGGYKQTDLDQYFATLGVRRPAVTAIAVDGGKNAPAGDPNSADAEVLLDIEIVGAVAPGAAMAVYFAPNTTRGFLDAITTAIHDKQHNPQVISISWGGPESTWTQQALSAYDGAFQDARALGIAVCAASGDDGSNDNETDGQAHVDFPASSPNVLACGGTRLEAVNGSIGKEVVWNAGPGHGATGGGVSEFFPLPAYQTSARVPPSVNSSKFVGRGVPDVAGDADPATGYRILVDGQQSVVGGTSAVAPLWAGLVALMNEQIGKPVGFLHTRLYGSGADTFNDIVSGNNGAYSAGPGWDPCTGLGSPNGDALLSVLSDSLPS